MGIENYSIIPQGLTPEQAWQKIPKKIGTNFYCASCKEHAYSIDAGFGMCKPCFLGFARSLQAGRKVIPIK